jgi:hypothetical protein
MKDFRLAAQNVNVMWNFCSLGSSLFYLSTARQETGGFPASVGGVGVLAPVARIGHPSLSFFLFLFTFIADPEKNPSDDTVNFVRIVRSFTLEYKNLKFL